MPPSSLSTFALPTCAFFSMAPKYLDGAAPPIERLVS